MTGSPDATMGLDIDDYQTPRLSQHQYDPDVGELHHVNQTEDYFIVLPYVRGAIRAARDGIVVHDGPVGPGTVRVIAPGERSSTAATRRFEAARVEIPRLTLEAIAGGRRAVDRVGAVSQARRELQLLCPSLVAALELRGRRRDLVVEGLTTTLMALVFIDPPAADPRSGLSNNQQTAAVLYALERMSSGVKLAAWAAAVGLGPAAFTQRFSATNGVAPYAWFMDRRIERARALLVAGELSILDVARETGFSSQSHFTDAFSRRSGVSPARWRVMYRGDRSAADDV